MNEWWGNWGWPRWVHEWVMMAWLKVSHGEAQGVARFFFLAASRKSRLCHLSHWDNGRIRPEWLPEGLTHARQANIRKLRLWGVCCRVCLSCLCHQKVNISDLWVPLYRTNDKTRNKINRISKTDFTSSDFTSSDLIYLWSNVSVFGRRA